ncbi:MAG TPA: NUDIX hydrolase [Candidatus Limnocylindria bacterium]|nr:NUDIX hydrolase [Candidatus Limnocylindria bacterium]
MKVIGSRQVWKGHVVSVRVDDVLRADGRRTTRDVVEHPGAVAIVAWDGERVAMVRQWRHATGGTLLEIPAGTAEPDEAPEATARRELAEEVGVAAASWRTGPSFFTAPGFCTEFMHLFFATDLSPEEAEGDEDEDLEVAWMTLDEAIAAADAGDIRDAKSILAILWLERHLRSA